MFINLIEYNKINKLKFNFHYIRNFSLLLKYEKIKIKNLFLIHLLLNELTIKLLYAVTNQKLV